MAKRFTDTGKWGKASFTDLPNEWKLVWIYLCDNCDHAGIWDVNWKLMAFHLGQPFSKASIEEAFGDKIKFLSETKLFIPSFVEFQYGKLNPDNRAHLSVINRLEKEGAYKGLIRSSQGRKDKDKDKDTVKDKEKDKEAFSLFWNSYPRKVGKGAAESTYKKLLAAGTSPEEMSQSLANYLAYLRREKTESKFILHGSTFMNQWKDWLDPAHGSAADFSEKQVSVFDIDLEGVG